MQSKLAKMKIEKSLQQAIAQALHNLYNIEADADSIVLQSTKKEFEGDYTLVVFPFVKQARKSPEVVANEIGEALKPLCQEIESYNVVKGFLNIVIDSKYWIDFVAENAERMKEAEL